MFFFLSYMRVARIAWPLIHIPVPQQGCTCICHMRVSIWPIRLAGSLGYLPGSWRVHCYFDKYKTKYNIYVHMMSFLLRKKEPGSRLAVGTFREAVTPLPPGLSLSPIPSTGSRVFLFLSMPWNAAHGCR